MSEVIDFIKNLSTSDLLNVLKVICPIFTYYVGTKTIDAYHIVKDYKPSKVTKVLLSPELKSKLIQ